MILLTVMDTIAAPNRLLCHPCHHVIVLHTALDTIAALVMILLTATETTAALHTTHRHHPFIMNIHHTPCMNHMITLNMITPCILSCLLITKNPNVILLRTAMDIIAALYTPPRYHPRYPKNLNVIHPRTAKD